MPPGAALDNGMNNRIADAIFFGKVDRARTVARGLANLYHRSIGQFGDWILLALFMITAPLIHFVAHVVDTCTKKQMSGVNASWIIAMVQHMQFVWNVTIDQEPSDPVGRNCFPVYSHSSIAESIPRAYPNPTIVACAFIDFFPKLIRQWANILVPLDESARFTFYRAGRFIAVVSERCLSTTTTLAVPVGDFVRGIIEGHDDLLCRFAKPRDAPNIAAAIYCSLYIVPHAIGFSYPTGKGIRT